MGSKESHDPPTVSGWLRAKSLHSIMNEHKMIEMKVWGQTVAKKRKILLTEKGRIAAEYLTKINEIVLQ